MPIIANTTSGNTFSAVRSQLNLTTKRMNQFAVNESAIYANTITANVSMRVSGTLLANNTAGTSGYYLRTSGTGVYWSPIAAQTQYLQVSNAAATYQTKTVERAALANTNSYIATRATWTQLLGTNTALRLLINDRLQVSNAAALYQTKAIERAALANTNLYIATRASWTALTGTNTALRTLISDRYQVANVNTLLAAKATWTGLTGTNTALRTLISDRYQVANVNTLLAAKATWAGLTGTNTALRTLISDRLQVANASATYLTKNNPVITGSLTANGTTGTSGYYLRTSGTGVYWSPAASGGGGSSTNSYSGILVGANVVVAGTTTDRLTLVAGSGITLAANPATDTITFSSTGGFSGGTVTGATTFTNSTASGNNATGAVKVTGGVGITGNMYTAGRVGFANTTSVSVAYTYYNNTTKSLDTVFGT